MSTPATPLILCSRPECKVGITGFCNEGHDPKETCPFFGNADSGPEVGEDESEALNTDESPNRIPTGIQLPSGEHLSRTAVDRFLLGRAARIVPIIGDTNSGKSTMIGALYEKFRNGESPFFHFTASRTLMAFERVVHDSRVSSNRGKADTLHTAQREGLKFYHLALTKTEGRPERVDLFMADRAGETFAQLRSGLQQATDFEEFALVDTVVLLIDGERLVAPTKRHGALQSARMTLKVLIDTNLIAKTSRVQVVTTKLDLIQKMEERGPLLEAIEAFKKGLERDIAPHVGALNHFEISARDPKGELTSGFGMDILLSSWFNNPIETPKAQHPSPTLSTQFDRLLSRTQVEEY